MNEAQRVETLEGKLLKYIDRFDAFGEALHEIFAGNKVFTINIIDQDLGLIELPTIFYQHYLPDFPKNNSEFSHLFEQPHPLFTIPNTFEMEQIVSTGVPHTVAAIQQRSEYAPYETWKRIIIESGDSEEIANLYEQKEFLH